MEVDENTTPAIESDQLERIHKALKGILDTTESRPIDVLSYADPFEPTNFKLIEVTDELAEHVLNGKELYISGAPDDQMVLCTKARTFNAKEVERSNSMMLTSMSDLPSSINEQAFRTFTVSSIFTRNIELTEAPLYKPTRFREILTACELNIFEDDLVFPDKKMKMKEIFSALPLSEDQIRCLLNNYPVFEVDGSIFCLNMEGREELVNELAYLLGDCNFDQIRESDLTESTMFSTMNKQFSSQVVDSIVRWVLHLFFEKSDDSTYKLKKEQISREICMHVLRKHASSQFIGIDEVEKQFYRLMPATISFDPKFLRGIAIVKKAASGETVAKYFSSEDLPLDDKQRLIELFKTSSAWTLEEIEPYILDFVDSKNAYDFLTKRCRSGVVDGKTMFYST